MDDVTRGYYIAYSHFMGIGPHKFEQLKAHFGDLKTAYHAGEKELLKALGPKTTANFIDFRNTFNIQKKLDEIAEQRIHIITREDPHYPPQLLNISDPPLCLYAKGDLNIIDFSHEKFFAIVGTRSPTTYGLYVAELFSRELSTHFVIVSGLAYGIDAASHTAALDAEHKTVAFLGCGVDITYPVANKAVYERIMDRGGLILSEFPPGMRTLRGHFVSRNRLISGLSQGVLVVEGAKRSGTLITARYAGEQGKDVFAPPSPINSPASSAPNILLQTGAKLVLSPSDILEEYGLKGNVKQDNAVDLSGFGAEEQRILKVILNEARRIDDIIVTTGMSANEVMKKLTLLEVDGIIGKNPDGTYRLVA